MSLWECVNGLPSGVQGPTVPINNCWGRGHWKIKENLYNQSVSAYAKYSGGVHWNYFIDRKLYLWSGSLLVLQSSELTALCMYFPPYRGPLYTALRSSGGRRSWFN